MIKRDIYIVKTHFDNYMRSLHMYHNRTYKYVSARPCSIEEGPMPSRGVTYNQARTNINPLNATRLCRRVVS